MGTGLRWPHILIYLLFAYAVVIGSLWVMWQQVAPEPLGSGSIGSMQRYDRKILEDVVRPTLGSTSAPFTLVFFDDPTCPTCRLALASLQEFMQSYPDVTRVIWRTWPRTADDVELAETATLAFLCAADQGQFWMYVEQFNQCVVQSAADLMTAADAVGINRDLFLSCTVSLGYQFVIDADAVAGQGSDVTEAGAVFINGWPVPAAYTVAGWRLLFEEYIPRLQALPTSTATTTNAL